MKFSINKIALLEALVVTGKCIASQSIIPALSCYKFDIENNKLEITGGNMQVFITQSAEIIGGEFSHSIGIPHTILLNWVKELADQPIEFTISERPAGKITVYTVSIVAGDAKCTIPCENGKDYPRPPQSPADQHVSVPSSDLLSGIDKTLFICANDILKPDFSGLNMVVDNIGLTLNGCDGSNLATKTIILESKPDVELNIIIPVKTMSILSSLPCDEVINMKVSERTIEFQVNEFTLLWSMLVDASYRDVKAIVPVGNDKVALIETKPLMSALKRAVQFAPVFAPVLILQFSDKIVKINATNQSGEAAAETLNIDYTGAPLNIRLHGPNLIKCVSKIDDAITKLQLLKETSHVIVADSAVTIKEKMNLMLTAPVSE